MRVCWRMSMNVSDFSVCVSVCANVCLDVCFYMCMCVPRKWSPLPCPSPWGYGGIHTVPSARLRWVFTAARPSPLTLHWGALHIEAVCVYVCVLTSLSPLCWNEQGGQLIPCTCVIIIPLVIQLAWLVPNSYSCVHACRVAQHELVPATCLQFAVFTLGKCLQLPLILGRFLPSTWRWTEAAVNLHAFESCVQSSLRCWTACCEWRV